MTPLGTSAALCHLLLLGLVVDTRLKLDTIAVDQPAPSHRALLRDDDGAAPSAGLRGPRAARRWQTSSS